MPGRSTKEKGREGEADEDGEERRFRGRIVQEVVAGIKEKESVHDWTARRRGGKLARRDQMTAQWDGEQKKGGDFGTNKDGREHRAVGGYAKCT